MACMTLENFYVTVRNGLLPDHEVFAQLLMYLGMLLLRTEMRTALTCMYVLLRLLGECTYGIAINKVTFIGAEEHVCHLPSTKNHFFGKSPRSRKCITRMKPTFHLQFIFVEMKLD